MQFSSFPCNFAVFHAKYGENRCFWLLYLRWNELFWQNVGVFQQLRCLCWLKIEYFGLIWSHWIEETQAIMVIPKFKKWFSDGIPKMEKVRIWIKTPTTVVNKPQNLEKVGSRKIKDPTTHVNKPQNSRLSDGDEKVIIDQNWYLIWTLIRNFQ